MTYEIKFGTSGWRERMDSGFDDGNVIRATEGICKYLEDEYDSGTIVVGYDTRKNGSRFAKLACDVVHMTGFSPLLTDSPTPTPATVLSVPKHNAIAGIQVTASHNPPEYNGLKFLLASGASPLPELTGEVEKLIPGAPNKPEPHKTKTFSAKRDYIDALQERFNPNNLNGLKVVVDTRHGAGAGYMAEILSGAGAQVIELNKEYDSDFGGLSPNPTEPNVKGLAEKVITEGAALGIANDGDADRFSIIDEKGRYYSANESGLILCDFMFNEKGEKGRIAKSIQSTAAFDRLASMSGVELVEVPVGFKHIAKELLDGAAFGVEGAALGVAFGNWIPDKDGMAAGVLMCEALASRKLPMSELAKNISSKYGYTAFLTAEVKASDKARRLLEELHGSRSETFGDFRIIGRSTLDGIKLNFEDGAWLLIRGSGTEPIIRFYSEANKKEEAYSIIAAAMSHFKE